MISNYKKPLILISLLFLGVVSFVVGRSLIETKQPASPTTPVPVIYYPASTPDPAVGSLQEHWLKGVPCQAPCWENITPGVTTVEEAVKQLKQMPAVRDVRINQLDAQKELGFISWAWANGETNYVNGDMPGNFIFYSTKDKQVVQGIAPGLRQTRFKDVIQLYGQPSHIIATYSLLGDGGYFTRVLYLIYSKQGILFASFSRETPTISPEMTLEGPQFFVPDASLQNLGRLQIPDRYLEKITTWQGFESFGYYCKGLKNGDSFSDCSKALSS